ncbi:hypothetical protein [Sphingomonas hankyongi]|uniref:Rap1a immunity protein domain-containing protein n=1 Tax=Sphingomonas hankyongi TaxID=2908209 RepID=A0ABT0S240_9SPHN|nr:hypothetical protein [Sphingomonas hankyongi]MCL6729917.1 hypothetical protein [Sphingomonas hankyongi]
MRVLLAVLVTAASSVAGATAPITAGEFLARAEPLMQKSKVTLLFSSEAKTLMKIVGEAARKTRVRVEADRAAGRPTDTCLPKGRASVSPDELLAYLRSLPPQRRGESFDQAFGGFAAKKYPCRG